MAGSRTGPVGKREGERVRTAPPAGGDAIKLGPDELSKLPFDIELMVEPPPADEDWHDVSRMMYEAALRDPCRIWMGPMDWATLYLMCENLSREMKPQAIGIVDGGIDIETGEHLAGHVAREVVPMKGTAVTALLRFLVAIGVTEAGRLALRKEITFNEAPTAERGVADDDVATDRSEVVPFQRPVKR